MQSLKNNYLLKISSKGKKSNQSKEEVKDQNERSTPTKDYVQLLVSFRLDCVSAKSEK